MMSRDEQANLSLDNRFEDILARIKPYLLKLQDPHDSRLCRLWLERLNQADDQRNLRNDYLFELYKQLKSRYLKAPFNKPPEVGKLIPISTFHRQLAASSSCNDLTETSMSLYDHKLNYPKSRSRSLRRDHTRRGKTLTKQHFDAHSSSPHRSSHADEPISGRSSPTVRFCDQDSRSDRHLLRKFRDRVETLSSIVEELESQNSKLKQKLSYYQGTSEEIPHLHARIKKLTGEIKSLRSKLVEVHEIKIMLEKNHKEIIDQYKTKMTQQFESIKHRWNNSLNENKELKAKIDTIEKKLKDLSREKDETMKSNDKTWTQTIQSVKADYEKLLHEKDMEIKQKDELLKQKDAELNQKVGEIDEMQEKLNKELQKLFDIKSNKDDKGLEYAIIYQYQSIKDELSKMRKNIENASSNKRTDNQRDIVALKKNVGKLEKYMQSLTQEYEEKLYYIIQQKDREIVQLQMQIDTNFQNSLIPPYLNNKQSETTDANMLDQQYQELLKTVAATADSQRCKYFKKLSFINDQLRRLDNG